ncbi:MAG: hypothetical protein ACX939_02320 [Hyphococcus sp.]
MIATHDLFVVGSDETSLCVAACAARAGARVAVLRDRASKSKKSAASVPCVPNDVWRRLDLQDFGMTTAPVSARATLLPAGKSVATYDNARRTEQSLAANGVEDHLLWSSFLSDMRRLKSRAAFETLVGESGDDTPPAAAFSDPARLAAIGCLSAYGEELLDDFFNDPQLKAHLAAHALGGAGLGAREPGVALALAQFAQDGAWRVRMQQGDGKPFSEILETLCEANAVTFYEGALLAVSSENGKHKTVELSGDHKAKTRCVFFASPDAADRAGVSDRRAPTAAPGKVSAQLRIKLRKPLEPPVCDARAIFQIVDGAGDLQAARDSALDGRLPDPMPVEFEFADNGDIIARTAYCPAAFREEDDWREWTGQDRQAVETRIMERLASRLNGLRAAVKKTKLDLVGVNGAANPRPAIAAPDLIVIQPDRYNAIGAAVALADKVLGHG